MSESVNHSLIENSPQLKAYYDNKRLFKWNVFWLLFGNAAAIFGQQTAGSLMPLHMAGVRLDAQQISVILGIGSVLAIPSLLYVSHLTDHWQSKWGRRLPFVAISFPFKVIALLLFPYAMTMLPCAALYLSYYMFNSILYTAYPYLFNDISKQQYWGRIAGFSNLTSFFAVWLGQVVLMPMVVTHGEKTVFVISAIFVGVASLLTVLFVREPPMRSETPPQFNPIPAIASVIKFGFSDIRRILICLAFGCVACGINLIIVYVPLQAKVNIGLTEAEIGRYILQFGTITNALLAVAAGWVIDKMGIFKSMMIGLLFLFFASVIGFNPTWFSQMFANIAGIKLSPSVFLAAAYTAGFMANPFIYLASNVYIMKSVQRNNFATFCACTGSTNLMMQSIIMVLTGTLIKYVSGNYGIAFAISIVLVAIGVIIFKCTMSVSSKEVNIDNVQTNLIEK